MAWAVALDTVARKSAGRYTGAWPVAAFGLFSVAGQVCGGMVWLW